MFLFITYGFQPYYGYGQEDVTPDSVTVQPDTSLTDTTIQTSNKALDAPVHYTARDSIRYEHNEQKVYLYGVAMIQYKDIELDAEYIEYDFGEKEVLAKYVLDSTGEKIGRPHFKDGKEEFDSDELRYNFETKKGIIKEVRTQVSEGFIDGEVVKKDADNTLFISEGEFCPCEDPEARTRFRVKKIKVMDELIVTGPGYMEIAGIPTPLAFPFGYFPNKDSQAAGIVIPTYGESPVLGFYLLGGGYYWPVSDHFDTQILGDIYSRGSWGLKNISRYNKRYKFNGNFQLSYTQLNNGDPEFPDYSQKKEFFVRWTHQQDARSNPYHRFSANVNAGTVNNFQNNFNTSANDYLSNTFQSNVSYTRIFPGKPYTLSANARHNQNSVTRRINVTLPEVAFNVSRFYPMKELLKNSTSRSKVLKQLEKVGMTFRSEMKNEVSMIDTLIDLNNPESVLDNMRNGMRHTANLNTSMNILGGKATFNPAVNWTGRMYIQQIEKYWDNQNQASVTDTLNQFGFNHNMSISGNITTKAYGYYTFKRGNLYKLRHVFTPVVNFTYRPDFGDEKTGFFGENGQLTSYSPNDIGVYGVGPNRESGLITINLINTLDAKLRTPNDTTGDHKKVNILDNFNFIGGYDLFRDSLNWSNIRMSGRTTLWKVLNINYNATLDPYHYTDEGIKIDQFALGTSGKLGRLTDASTALGFRLQSNRDQDLSEEESDNRQQQMAMMNAYPGDFVDFDIPWSMNVNYTVRLNRSFFNEYDPALDETIIIDSTFFTQTLGFNGDFNLTENWKVAFSSGYDFVANDFSYTSLSVYRDLNCWEMNFSWVPFGPRQSYNISINLKSPMLKDLKLQRRRSWYDNSF